MMLPYSTTIEIQLHSLQALLQTYPDGATLEQINEEANLGLEQRTLQRRMGLLLSRGIIIKSGNTKSARYSLAAASALENCWSVQEDPMDYDWKIPLTPESKEILKYLSLPSTKRKQVGYNPSFLDHYEPDKTFYLTENERKSLRSITAVPGIEGQPAGTFARHILERLIIDLSWNSSRLEGNSYSLLETERLLALDQPVSGKSMKETQMLLNHKDAIEILMSGLPEIGINRYTLLNLHASLSNNLLANPAAEGKIRSFAVGIRQSAYRPPSLPAVIDEMFDFMLAKAAAIVDPHEQALFLMVHLPYLQPFEDVNKRTSRLAANIPLNQYNLVPLSFIDVPKDLYVKGMLGIYELNQTSLLKDVFLWACERSANRYAEVRQVIGEPDAFRLKYGHLMQELVSSILLQALSHIDADRLIKTRLVEVSRTDHFRFTEMVHTEILGLHEGKIARYRAMPSQFRQWKENWAK